MNVPLIFVAVIVGLLALYMMNRFVRRPGVLSAFLLLIQLLAASIVVFSLFEKVLTTSGVELAVIITGILFPMPVIIYDHIKIIQKRKSMGVNIQLVEKKKKAQPEKWNFSYFTDNAELWKEEIYALTVYKSLNINDKSISKNVKKKLILIQRLINLERYETAAEQYRFLFAILPDSAAIAYNTGFLHCFTGKYREAYKILNKAHSLMKKGSKMDREDKSALPAELGDMIEFNTGYALFYLGKFEHSIRHFQKVLNNKSDLTVAYKNIARAYLAINMEDEAIEYLEKGRLDLRDSLMRIVLGSIYYRKGDTKKALEVLDEVVVSDTKQIEALKCRGKAAIKEKMFDKAMECFEKLIDLEPDSPAHYYHLALSQSSLMKKEDALKTYEKGIFRHPDNSTLLYNAGTLLDEMGQKEKAVKYLYKSLEGNEILEDTYNYLGVLLGQMKRYREAVQVFDKGVDVFDKSYQLYFNRGIVLEMSRRLEDAVLSFEIAYDLNRKDQVLIYHYTAVLLKSRQYAKAIRIYKTSLSSYPDDEELYYGLSKVYARMGDKDVAVELLKKSLELNPAYLSKIKKDIDFKTLYRHEGYKSLMVS